MARQRWTTAGALLVGALAVAVCLFPRAPTPALATSSVTPPHPIVQTLTVHPPGRGACTLLLTAERPAGAHPRGSHLYLREPTRSGLRELSPSPAYNFWSASAGDVDGDGAEDLALCTWSRTARHPQYARRLFVYSWTRAGDLTPRWRGSRLCRPYTWAALRDLNRDGRAELLSLEVGLRGGRHFAAYAWNQFGFWGVATSPEYRSLEVVDPSARGASGQPAVLMRVTDFGSSSGPHLRSFSLAESGFGIASVHNSDSGRPAS